MNIAVHGTCLGISNALFSADLMGCAERALEAKLGGGVAIFTNAAVVQNAAGVIDRVR